MMAQQQQQQQQQQQHQRSRRILIAVDGSKHSRRALDWYAANAACPHDQLVFAYIAEPPPISLGAGYASVATAELYTNSVQDAVSAGKRLAAEMRELCESLGLRNEIRFVERLSASAGPALCDIATEEAADLIIVGNRGIGTLRRTFMGSVSDYVLHHSHRPMAIIPPPHPGQGAEAPVTAS